MLAILDVTGNGFPGDDSPLDAGDLLALFDKAAANGLTTFYFPPGTYNLNGPIVLRSGYRIQGAGPTSWIKTLGSDGVHVEELATDCVIEDLRFGGGGSAMGATGLVLTSSQNVRVRGVDVRDYRVGIELTPVGQPGAFTGYVSVSKFVIVACLVGVRATGAANGISLRDGRILGDKAIATSIEIDGADALSIDTVAMEGAKLPLSIRGRGRITVTNCYFEPGDASSQSFDVRMDPDGAQALSSLVFKASHFDPAQGRLVAPPEALVDFDGPSAGNFGARRHFAAQASRNFARNGDLRQWQNAPFLFIPNWGAGGPPAVAEELVDIFDPPRAMRLTQQTGPGDSVSCGFLVPDGCSWVTAGVRYKAPGTHGFHVAVQAGGDLATFDEMEPNAEWKEIFLTTNVGVGAKTGTVIIQPDTTGSGGTCLVDAVWVTSGRVATVNRAYGERLELLERPVLLVSSVTQPPAPVWNAAPIGGLERPPDAAIGALLRLSIVSTDTSAARFVEAAPGTEIVPAARCYALFPDHENTLDLVVRGTVFSGTYGEAANAPAAQTAYRVFLLGWVLL